MVNLKLDGVAATNARSAPGSADMNFVVYDDMQRFGVQVPPGTKMLDLVISGYNTNLELVKSGTAMLDLSVSSEVAVPLK